MGDGHRRPPGRRQQLEQRLVDVGARPHVAHASSPAATRATTTTGTPTDIALLAELGFNTYRFSIEWSRIEPEDGEFSRAALDHYRRVCAACHEQRHHARRHVPPLHDAAVGRPRRRLGGARHRRSLRPVRRAGDRGARRPDGLGAARSTSPTSWRRSGTSPARSRRAARDAQLRRAVNDIIIDAHHKAVDGDAVGSGRLRPSASRWR